MSGMAYQITGTSIVCSTVWSGADQRKHQSYASLAIVKGIHRWSLVSPHKGPVTRRSFHVMTPSCTTHTFRLWAHKPFVKWVPEPFNTHDTEEVHGIYYQVIICYRWIIVNETLGTNCWSDSWVKIQIFSVKTFGNVVGKNVRRLFRAQCTKESNFKTIRVNT